MKKVGNWQQLDSKCVYENPWIQVHHENVLTPKGTPGIYGCIHFKNRAVGVLAFNDDGQLCLVKQSRYTLNCYTLEIPEGGAPLSEPLLAAAKRELEEETGWKALEWRELLTIHQSNSVSDETGTVFVATKLEEGEQALEDSEDIEVSWVHPRELLELVFKGEISDSLTVVAVLRAYADEEYRHLFDR